MDEPLSNLDAGLRVRTRTEIKRLQRDLGITAVFVTHDQEEAMVLSDRVAVMRDGKLQQIGPPMEVYRRAGQPVRRLLHRQPGHELPRRRARPRRTARCSARSPIRRHRPAAGGDARGSAEPAGLPGRRAILGIRPSDLDGRRRPRTRDQRRCLSGRADRPGVLCRRRRRRAARSRRSATRTQAPARRRPGQPRLSRPPACACSTPRPRRGCSAA